MVFNNNLIIGLLVLLILGFCALTYIVWKLQVHYNRLTGGVNTATLSQVLNDLLNEIRDLKVRTTHSEEAESSGEGRNGSHTTDRCHEI